jgi:DNA topoisomerase-1
MMPAAKYERVTVRLENNDFKFYTYNKKLIYDGYRKVYGQVEGKANENDIGLDSIKIGKTFKNVDIEIKQHESSPPARYNQASLIKTLDEEGVGRPSTYRTMAQVNLDRGYVVLESKAFVMTPLGNDIIENLGKFFPYVIDVKFTREMEEHLDEIAKKSEG